MRIRIQNQPTPGVRLGEVPFGSVVQRAVRGDGETYYLVAATMDATGRRCLVTLGGGSLKFDVEQSLRVIVVDAELVINGSEVNAS